MEEINKVFQTDSEIVNKIYKEEPNYLIDHNKVENSETPYCILYFCSHDIYYPNKKKVFADSIIKKNTFEWYRTRVKKGEKHIFLRDIKKQWYLTGINENINSIGKLAKFLKEETEGYRLITIGSSAGGYAAVLLGQLLNAEKIYSFNGRVVFKKIFKESSPDIDPVIFRERKNPEINKYFDLKPHITNPENIYYFNSLNSEKDEIQFQHIADLDINFISFRTSHHGVPFLKSNLEYIINCPAGVLDELSKGIHYPLLFSMKIEGFTSTILSLFNQSTKYLQTKAARSLKA
jgi:hypothetical protein